MKQDNQGNVTLTQNEFKELHEAYQRLCDTLDSFTSSMQDFCRSDNEYLNIRKWECLLNGEEFDYSDWI